MTAVLDRTGVRFVTDRRAVLDGLTRTGSELSALLRRLPPDAAQTVCPGLEWTVGETAAHVVTVVRRSLGDRQRSTSPADTHGLNALRLDALAERHPGRLADLLDADLARVVKTVVPRFPDDDLPVAFHGGTTTRLLTAYGIMLLDLLVHRWDIAGAVGAGEPPPEEPSVPALQALLELLPVWVDPSAVDEVDVLVDVAGDACYLLALAPGRLDVTRDGSPDDGVPRVRTTAGDLLLALCGRVRPEDPALARICAAVLPV